MIDSYMRVQYPYSNAPAYLVYQEKVPFNQSMLVIIIIGIGDGQ
jgi:hypothetical protein